MPLRHRLRAFVYGREDTLSTHISPDPPKLEELSFNMTRSSTDSTQRPATPTHIDEGPQCMPAAQPVSDRDSPTQAPRPIDGQTSPTRSPAHESDHITSNHISNMEHSVLSSRFDPKKDTSTSEVQSLPWSAAVGHATTGKSGRVIERLMGENDHLRRDVKLKNLRYEEEAKRSEMARSKLENLQATNDNLVASHEVDKAALARRDRKFEELKAELEVERRRREMAEQETKDTTKERDEVVSRCRRELMEEKETARKITAQYDVLSSSWKTLSEGYRRQLDKLRADIKLLTQRRVEDRTKLERLVVVMEQTRRESEKMSQAKQAVSKIFQDYKAESEEGMKDIRERAARNEEASHGALEEMEKVVGEMRYIINLKKDLKDAE